MKQKISDYLFKTFNQDKINEITMRNCPILKKIKIIDDHTPKLVRKRGNALIPKTYDYDKIYAIIQHAIANLARDVEVYIYDSVEAHDIIDDYVFQCIRHPILMTSTDGYYVRDFDDKCYEIIFLSYGQLKKVK